MKRILLSLLCMVMGFANAFSQEFPTISTGENVKWYLIQFVGSSKVIDARASDSKVVGSVATGKSTQLWKITGDASNGYTLTNKAGYTLYVNSAEKSQMVQASKLPMGNSKFLINATTHSKGGHEIQPKGNTSISMNLWEETGNNGIGLWDKGNQYDPVEFVEVQDYSKISLIPYPQEMTANEGNFDFKQLNAIACCSEKMQGHISNFVAQLQKSSGIILTIKEAGETSVAKEIWFGTDGTLPKDGYTLDVKEDRIEIKASSHGGELYALQTLMQLLPREYFNDKQSEIAWNIPVVSIKDSPKFQHRGFMMDVARHFFDKEQVKKVLDIMAFYKMNRLHWHLTDDQGWRIEIPEYPLLTEIGAVRAGSFTSNGENGHGGKFFDDTEYGRGMFFTQNDLREIVAYATERNIDILPEIDLPGHMVAAVASYPELSCDPTKEYSVRIDGGISNDVLNVGKDEVIDFLKTILRNVAEIFPFPYIHIGGDECPTEQWQNNQDCLRRVQEEGLAGVQELQSWLVEELGAYLKTLGENSKEIVVWDEVLKNWNTENKVKPIIMAWNDGGAKYAKQAAELGFNSILCPYSNVYIDFMQVPADQTLIDEPYYGGWGDGWVNTIENVYELNPLKSLEGKEDFCLGAQCNLWAETLNDGEELEYQLLPRMLALAEITWLPNENKNWISFYQRLQKHDEILDQLGYTYAKHYIEPTELTAEEQTIQEAEEIIANSIRGAVGYPAADIYDALQSALEGGVTETINEAIANYKNAPIVMPQTGKTYQIVSASTYYKRQYEGSTMYVSEDEIRFHYTPQIEPEELWQFIATEGGYTIKNLGNGMQISMPTYNKTAQMAKQGTPVRIDKATIPTKNYTYIPGVVTISAIEGYNAAETGSVKRLSAFGSGDIKVEDEASLCYNGTWKIVEVTDFTAQLKGLIKKSERLIEKAKPGEYGEPTQAAIENLQNSVITPAKELIETSTVTEQQYNSYLALYNQFLMSPRASLADEYDLTKYYYIRNGYFTDKYAALNTSNNKVEPTSKGNSDNFLWQFVKNTDGTVHIYNKANGQAAYIDNTSEGSEIFVGREYSWTLRMTTTDLNNTGISIISKNGTQGWYTNPSSWTSVILKPYYWGAGIWTFEITDIEVPTSIKDVKVENANSIIYDLQGRHIEKITERGIYIVNGKKVFVK